MNLMTPPEIADGGYWYVQALDPSFDGQSPLIPDISFCAWYGSGVCVVRTVVAMAGVKAVEGATTDSVLAASGVTGKPYGRLGGN
jgi:hypothetical protein